MCGSPAVVYEEFFWLAGPQGGEAGERSGGGGGEEGGEGGGGGVEDVLHSICSCPISTLCSHSFYSLNSGNMDNLYLILGQIRTKFNLQ